MVTPLFTAEDGADKYPESQLFDRPVAVVEGLVWSSNGATAPPTYENAGHNNNLTFIGTVEGVVVINAGDNYLPAEALPAEIKKITDQPVQFVNLGNWQGHDARF